MNTGALTARLSHSMTIGADRDVSFRMVHVASCCLFVEPGWLAAGWVNSRVSLGITCFRRLCNYSGCLRADLPYDTACAIKNRFLSGRRTAAHLERSIELLDTTFLENLHAQRKRRIERAEGEAGLSRRLERVGHTATSDCRSS